MGRKLDLTLVGGGMIVHDQILPSLYHLQRIGELGAIDVCARHSATVRKLRDNSTIGRAFPDQSFDPHPAYDTPDDQCLDELYKEVLTTRRPRQIAVVALPDQVHYEAVMYALLAEQHVLCVKPLVLKYQQAEEIERLAREKGLLVAVEYHKRFDPRALMARQSYADGDYGEFRMGEAKMIEPYSYRNSNFANWFTVDQPDPFVYVSCHYVDQVAFITGLRPVEVSVSGVKGRFSNGNEAFMWTNGRVRFENGALLSVTSGLGYPDLGAGGNEQCITMFCEGDGQSGLIKHDDQRAGVRHCYLTAIGPGGSHYNFRSPDYFRLIPWEGDGLRPVGYGYESIAASIRAFSAIEDAVEGMNAREAQEECTRIIERIDAKGLIATPANSFYNELVVEAGRLSIMRDGLPVEIWYGDEPHVSFRD